MTYRVTIYQNSILSVLRQHDSADQDEEIAPDLSYGQLMGILQAVQGTPQYQSRLADGPSFGYTCRLTTLPPALDIPEPFRVPVDFVPTPTP